MSDIDPLSADFAVRHPDAFARVLGQGSIADIADVLNALPSNARAAVVARLAGPHIDALLSDNDQGPEQWLQDASFDDAMTFLNRLPRERRLALINAMNEGARRQQLLRHQQFPKHSVGALVSDIAYRIIEDALVADVLKALRGDAAFAKGRHKPVVVDRSGRYVGLLDVWRLALDGAPASSVRDFVRRVPPIFPDTSIVSAAQNDAWHAYSWLPVVDHRQNLLGGVSRKRLFEAEQAHTQSVHSATHSVALLGADVVRVLGALLESLLGRKSSS